MSAASADGELTGPRPRRRRHARLHHRFTRSFPLGHKKPPLQGNLCCYGCGQGTTISDGEPRGRDRRPRERRVDMHCHSTASQVSRLGVQRAVGPARVRDAAAGGLRARQAARHGLRDDHRPRHDRRRARDRRPPRRVHLRGADRALPRRAAGGARALLRDHAARTTSGCRRTAATSSSAPRTCTSSEIACALAHPYYTVAAPLTARHRRRLARAVRDLGDAQRRPRPRAQPARRHLRRHARRRSASAAATTTPASTSAAPSPKRRPRGRRASSSRTCARGEVLARGAQGSAAKWAHAAIALAARSLGGEPADEHARAARTRARVMTMVQRAAARGRRAPGRRRQRPRRPRTRAACCARGCARRARRPRRARADRLHAGRALQPRRPLPARLPRCTSASCARRSRRAIGAASGAGRRAGRRRRGSSRRASRRSRTRRRPRSSPASRRSSRRSPTARGELPASRRATAR